MHFLSCRIGLLRSTGRQREECSVLVGYQSWIKARASCPRYISLANGWGAGLATSDHVRLKADSSATILAVFCLFCVMTSRSNPSFSVLFTNLSLLSLIQRPRWDACDTKRAVPDLTAALAVSLRMYCASRDCFERHASYHILYFVSLAETKFRGMPLVFQLFVHFNSFCVFIIIVNCKNKKW